MFLGWLVSNGVQGLGTTESKLGLYDSESGERGFVATKDITSGDILLRVPLRLALTDHDDDEDNKCMYEGAPWSVRLSAKLLRELAAGEACPRWPYLQVLPRLVPAPLEILTWDEMKQIQYLPGQKKLHEYEWLVADAYSRCSPEALGGATAERFQWAMSIVHSRTFGNAARDGGVGVHMLVPLVDMFNHGGDVTQSGLLSDPLREPTDSVRWDIKQCEDGSWEMVVSAIQDVEAGHQLLLSYGERCNDDFFLHYGFVPEANPQDTVQLFEDLSQALDWHYDVFTKQRESHYQELIKDLRDEGAHSDIFVDGLLHPDHEEVYAAALEEALKLQQEQQQKAQQKAGPGSKNEQKKSLLLHAGGNVDPALMLAFGAAVGNKKSNPSDSRTRQHCLTLLEARCLQLLQEMDTELMQDLAALWMDAIARGDQDTVAQQLKILEHYRKAFTASGLLRARPFSPSAAARSHVDTPIEAYAWQHYLSIPASASYSASASSPGSAGRLSAGQQLLLRYRTSKKMVLTDAVLAVEAALSDMSAKPGATATPGTPGKKADEKKEKGGNTSDQAPNKHNTLSPLSRGAL